MAGFGPILICRIFQFNVAFLVPVQRAIERVSAQLCDLV